MGEVVDRGLRKQVVVEAGMMSDMRRWGSEGKKKISEWLVSQEEGSDRAQHGRGV